MIDVTPPKLKTDAELGMKIGDYPVDRRYPNFEYGLPDTYKGAVRSTAQFRKMRETVEGHDLTPEKYLALALSVRDSWEWRKFRDLDQDPGRKMADGSDHHADPAEYGYGLERYMDAHSKILGFQEGWHEGKALEEVFYPLQRKGLLEKFETEDREHPLNRVTKRGCEVALMHPRELREWERAGVLHIRITVDVLVIGMGLGCLAWFAWHGSRETKEGSAEPDGFWVPPLNRHEWDWDRAVPIEVDPDPEKHREKVTRQTGKHLKPGGGVVWATASDEMLRRLGHVLMEGDDGNRISYSFIDVGWGELEGKRDVVLQPVPLQEKTMRERKRREERIERTREKVKKAIRANWDIYPEQPEIGGLLRAKQKLGKEDKWHGLGKVRTEETLKLAKGQKAPDELEKEEENRKKEREIKETLDHLRNPSIRFGDDWIWVDGEKKWRATPENTKIARKAG